MVASFAAVTVARAANELTVTATERDAWTTIVEVSGCDVKSAGATYSVTNVRDSVTFINNAPVPGWDHQASFSFELVGIITLDEHQVDVTCLGYAGAKAQTGTVRYTNTLSFEELHVNPLTFKAGDQVALSLTDFPEVPLPVDPSGSAVPPADSEPPASPAANRPKVGGAQPGAKVHWRLLVEDGSDTSHQVNLPTVADWTSTVAADGSAAITVTWPSTALDGKPLASGQYYLVAVIEGGQEGFGLALVENANGSWKATEFTDGGGTNPPSAAPSATALPVVPSAPGTPPPGGGGGLPDTGN